MGVCGLCVALAQLGNARTCHDRRPERTKGRLWATWATVRTRRATASRGGRVLTWLKGTWDAGRLEEGSRVSLLRGRMSGSSRGIGLPMPFSCPAAVAGTAAALAPGLSQSLCSCCPGSTCSPALPLSPSPSVRSDRAPVPRTQFNAATFCRARCQLPH